MFLIKVIDFLLQILEEVDKYACDMDDSLFLLFKLTAMYAGTGCGNVSLVERAICLSHIYVNVMDRHLETS